MKSLLYFLTRKKNKNKGQAVMGYKKSCVGFFAEGVRKAVKTKRMKIGELDEFLELAEPACGCFLLV